MINLANIDNIIFDLGDVILPIDFDAPAKMFKKLGVDNFKSLYGQFQQNDLFDQLEMGKISEKYFRDNMRKIANANWSDIQIDDAWNAMLCSYRPETIAMLKDLKHNFKLYLLSNTNSIHYKKYDANIRHHLHPNGLSSLFHKAFYSHEMGCRKPDKEIFLKVIDETKIDISKTIFIDDNADNIQTAKNLGFCVHHMSKSDKIEEILQY